MTPVRTVGVVARRRYPELSAVLERVSRAAEERELEVRFEKEVLDLAPEGALALRLGDGGSADPEDAPIDALLTLGGDGTLLRGARLVAGFGIPVLGINLGHLGFLAAAGEHEIEPALDHLVQGDVVLDRRFTLEATIVHGDGSRGEEFLALNDFVVHKAGVARVAELDLVVGEGSRSDEIGSFSGDGVVVSTPTGSTAYSLSAGGPIIVPTVDCIVVTPICPHTLAFRPLVIPAGESVTVRSLEPTEDLVLTVDGKLARELSVGDSVIVARGDVQIPLVRFPDQSFFSTLRRKLNWAARHREEG